MKSTRTLLALLVASLLLGLAAGLGVVSPGAGADPGTSTAPSSSISTTTTTTPTSTTDPTSTDTTSTVPSSSSSTTDTTPPSTTTTTTPSTTTTTTTAPVAETTGQSSTTTTVPGPPPTAPCDTTQITCGNNAATQLAIVSQTCTANSANSILNVDITTLSGTPVNDVTITPQTNCLNQLSITQIVRQYCVDCTVIVIPPPPPRPIYEQTVVQNNPTTTIVQHVMAYCMPYPVPQPDGTTSTLVYLEEGQPLRDPEWQQAVPATFVPGSGMTCPVGATSPGTPIFTLTVPASFVGQYVNLCIQPSAKGAKPLCHAVRIDTGATISIPVTANIRAQVLPVKLAKSLRPKSRKAITSASSLFAKTLAAGAHPQPNHKTTLVEKGGAR